MTEANAQVPRSTHRRLRPCLRISVGMLMLLVAALAVGLGWLAQVSNRARRQAEVVEAMYATGRTVLFLHEYARGVPFTQNWPIWDTPQPAAPEWLGNWLGDDYFRKIAVVDFGRSDFWSSRDTRPASFRNDDEVLIALCKLGDVKNLSLRMFEVGESRLGPIRCLRGLEVLHLGPDLRISDDDLACLQNLLGLLEVRIANDRITGRGLAYLTELPALESLHLTSNAIDERQLVHLAAMRKLRILTLSAPTLKDAALRYVVKTPALESLHFYGGDIAAAGVATLGALRNLRWLDLSSQGEPLTDRALEALRQLNRLESLSICGRPRCTAFTEDGLLNLVGSLPRLESLWLETQYFDRPVLREIKRRYPKVMVYCKL